MSVPVRVPGPGSARHIAGAILCLTFLLVISLRAEANWPPDGEMITSEPGAQEYAHLVPDGAGGVIIAWEDNRVAWDPLYLQRVDGAGNDMWTENGIGLTYSGEIVEILPDGACGAILVSRDGGGDIWVSRIDHSGAVVWTVTGGEFDAHVLSVAEAVSDGAGGVIVAWNDQGVGYPVCAQRIDSNGNVCWAPGGVELGGGTGDTEISLASDGSSGAIVAFSYGSGPYFVCVERVYGSSGALWPDTPDMFGCAETDYLNGFAIDADAYGGSILVLAGGDDPETDIYVQKIDPAGMAQWDIMGISYGNICYHPARQYGPDVICDGLGGAFIIWLDERGASQGDIWGQRVDAYGVPLWTANGVPIRIDGDSPAFDPAFLDLYDTHALIGWNSEAEYETIFAQKLDLGGSILWPDSGVTVLSGEFSLGYDIKSDGAENIFACTTKDAPGYDAEVYAIAVNSFGEVAAPAPTITAVTDVPDDQGGKVRIYFTASDRDVLAAPPDPVSQYGIWQQIAGPVTMEGRDGPAGEGPDPGMSLIMTISPLEAPDLDLFEDGSRRFVRAAPGGAWPGGTWEYIGGFGATQIGSYCYRASTTVDSSAAGNPIQYYIVSAHTADPAEWFVSNIGGGYSVDNLAPAPPLGLAGEQSYSPEGLQLTWDPNTENDLWHYSVYRGTSSDFTPGPGNIIATPQTDEFFDEGWTWDTGFWYKVSAVDENGNESGFAVAGPGEITGDDPMPVPAATFLSQNYPNPFNPATSIAFGIKESGHVSLRIYDAAGRLVAKLVDGSRPAGNYSVDWDGRGADGSAAASGVYFYSLETEEFTKTLKMILLR